MLIVAINSGQGDQRAKRHWLLGPKPPVQRHGRAVLLTMQAVGVVDLVGLASADQALDAGERGVKLGLSDAGLQLHDAAGAGV